jgi:hypothetical protein
MRSLREGRGVAACGKGGRTRAEREERLLSETADGTALAIRVCNRTGERDESGARRCAGVACAVAGEVEGAKSGVGRGARGRQARDGGVEGAGRRTSSVAAERLQSRKRDEDRHSGGRAHEVSIGAGGGIEGM